MTGTERLTYQIELSREIYLAERSRIDQIRGSLGLHLAALSFTAAAVAALSRILRFADASAVELALSLLSAGLSVAALVMLVRAAYRLREFDYTFSPVSPQVTDFAAAVDVSAKFYEDRMGMSAADALATATDDVLGEIAAGYSTSATEIAAQNERNLSLQKEVFRDLLASLAILLAAIACAGALRLVIGIDG